VDITPWKRDEFEGGSQLIGAVVLHYQEARPVDALGPVTYAGTISSSFLLSRRRATPRRRMRPEESKAIA